MKKNYSTPVAEKIEFDYTESVLASGADTPDEQQKPESVPISHITQLADFDPQHHLGYYIIGICLT